MHFQDLDENVRIQMVEEVRLDVREGTLYMSPRLSQAGQNDWSELVTRAAESGTAETLAAELRMSGRLLTTEMAHRQGGLRPRSVPVTAADTLAQGEFNRFYIRAVCATALNSGQSHVRVYRARDVASPRPASEMLIGSVVDARMLLDDLRSNVGVDTALGVPAGPNSGLSVQLLPSEPAIGVDDRKAS